MQMASSCTLTFRQCRALKAGELWIRLDLNKRIVASAAGLEARLVSES